ncbi:MAG: DUF58 domain-containing protein [bacterium]|nr:DUF58 domain-containing protein [bacterium]
MRPGELLVRLLGLLSLVALLAPLVPILAAVAFLGLAVLVAAAVGEALLLRRLRLRVERREVVTLSLDESEEVELGVESSAPRPVRLVARQRWPALAEPASVTRRGVCRPGELLRLAFEVRGVERGVRTLEAPSIAATFWGLCERILAPVPEPWAKDRREKLVEGPGEMRVLPNLRAVRRLDAELQRFALLGLGSRAAALHGKGREFERLREYVAGDDYRDVAWKASAHHGKWIVREFRLDRSQDVVVCVDRGHRMAARVGHLSRLDHALNAALLLAYISDRMEDRVGLLAFAAEAEQGLAQGRGSVHLRRLTEYATALRAEYLYTDYLALAAHLRRRLRHRTLVLLLTTLPELEEHAALRRAVELLTPQHLPIVIVFADPALRATAEVAPVDHGELCRTLVARQVLGACQRTVAALRRRGALVVEAAPGEAGIAAVNAYLEVKRAQLL